MPQNQQQKFAKLINAAKSINQQIDNRGGMYPQDKGKDWRKGSGSFGAQKPITMNNSLYEDNNMYQQTSNDYYNEGSIYDDEYGTLPDPNPYNKVQQYQQQPQYQQQEYYQPQQQNNIPNGVRNLFLEDVRQHPNDIPKSVQDRIYSDVGMNSMEDISLDQLLSPNNIVENYQQQPPIQENPYKPKKKQVLKENYIGNNNGGIDYSTINALIKQGLDEAVEEIQKSIILEVRNGIKKILNDSDELAILKLSDSINLVTKNGKVYEGKLKYKGILNE